MTKVTKEAREDCARRVNESNQMDVSEQYYSDHEMSWETFVQFRQDVSDIVNEFSEVTNIEEIHRVGERLDSLILPKSVDQLAEVLELTQVHFSSEENARALEQILVLV